MLESWHGGCRDSCLWGWHFRAFQTVSLVAAHGRGRSVLASRLVWSLVCKGDDCGWLTLFWCLGESRLFSSANRTLRIVCNDQISDEDHICVCIFVFTHLISITLWFDCVSSTWIISLARHRPWILWTHYLLVSLKDLESDSRTGMKQAEIRLQHQWYDIFFFKMIGSCNPYVDIDKRHIDIAWLQVNTI